MKLMNLVVLAGLMGGIWAYGCPDGIREFASLNDTEYYVCERGADVAVLTPCDTGLVFNRKTLKCTNPNLVKRDLHSSYIMNREATGEQLTLGTLYDDRKRQMYNGFNLWTQKTIKAESDVSNGSRNLNSYTRREKSFASKADLFSIDASLQLDFLGGVISVKGSAEFLKDDKKTTNIARVVYKSQYISTVATIRDTTPVDFTKLCENINQDNGPTHVVIEVVYGLRSFFVFDKKVTKNTNVESVTGKLEAEMKLIPGFEIKGSVVITTTGSTVKNIDDISVKFYGDAILDYIPTTYLQASRAYAQTVSTLKDDGSVATTPVAYSLAPIDRFCTGDIAIINELSTGLLNGVTGALIELKLVQQFVDTLMEKESALRYQAIRHELIVFDTALKLFATGFKKRVSELLPQIKAKQVEEGVLSTHLLTYTNSVFRKATAEMFLKARKREIDTIDEIISDAMNRDDITLSDIKSATDNACMFKHNNVAAFVLNILPARNITQIFLDGKWEPNPNAWFYDNSEVVKVGNGKRKFIEYVDTNLKVNKDHCFILKLGNIANGMASYEMHLYKKGDLITKNFVLPELPPTPECSHIRYDGFELTSRQVNNDQLSGNKVNIERLDNGGAGSSVQFLPNADKIDVINLAPYAMYTMTTRYVVNVDQGVGPETGSVTCTTLASSPPAILTVLEITKTYLKLSWARPTVIAPQFWDKITYTILLTGPDGKKTIKTKGLTATYPIVLKPGTRYTITAYANVEIVLGSVTEVLESDPARLVFSTAPAAPEQPVNTELEDNRAVFTIATGKITVPTGVSKELLIVKYRKESGDDNIFVQRIVDDEELADIDLSGLESDTKYSVSVKIMVRVDEDTLLASDFSPQSSVTTTNKGADTDALRKKLKLFKINTERRLDELETQSQSLNDKISGANNSLSSLDVTDGIFSVGARFDGVAVRSHAYQKDRCIEDTFDYYTSPSSILATYQNIVSIQECLSKCKDKDGCASVTYHNTKLECKLKNSRRGSTLWSQKNMASTNIYCSMGSSASISTWATCLQKDKVYPGTTLVTAAGVGSMGECIALCRATNKCLVVSYKAADKNCYLMEKRGVQATASAGVDSLNLYCLGTQSANLDGCTEASKKFDGAVLKTLSTTDTLRTCVNACTNNDGCESVSYSGSGKQCQLNTKRRGSSQSTSVGWASINMMCLALQHT